MSKNKALVTFENAGLDSVEALQSFQQGLSTAASKQDGGGSLEGCELLKMDKNDGEWHFGIDGEEVHPDDLIAINVLTLMHGFIDWAAGSISGEVMVSIMEPLPNRRELEEAEGKNGWQEQLQFDAKFYDDAEAADIVLRYKQNSQGGREAVRNICKAVVAKLNAGSEYIFPVVSLTSSNYKHKEFGVTYKPVFEIEFFINTEGEREPEKTKKLSSKAKAKVVEEDDEEVEEAPKRRRRKEAPAAKEETPKKKPRRRKEAPVVEEEYEDEDEYEEEAPKRRRRKS